MRYRPSIQGDPGERAEEALCAVLPRGVTVGRAAADDDSDLLVNGQPLRVAWVGDGHLRDVRSVVSRRRGRPDIVAARRMSPGARDLLSRAGIGWVDESGAAEIAVGTIVVSRTGRAAPPDARIKRWTPAVLAVAEALLCGTDATVSATADATGLSSGSCTGALRFLAEQGLLESGAARGPTSGRRVPDPDRLLDAYGAAVEAAVPGIGVQVGILARDPLAELAGIGRTWDTHRVGWALTGAAGAAVLAPYLTEVRTVEVYVDATTLAGLEAVAADAGLRPIEAGRLTLRPFPTVAVARLAQTHGDLRVAPWPRVYVDLRSAGVRGEGAAEHLRDVVNA